MAPELKPDVGSLKRMRKMKGCMHYTEKYKDSHLVNDM